MGGLSDRVQQVQSNLLPSILPKVYRKEQFPEFRNAQLIGDGIV